MSVYWYHCMARNWLVTIDSPRRWDLSTHDHGFLWPMQNSNDPGHCKKGEQERYFMVYLDVVSLVIWNLFTFFRSSCILGYHYFSRSIYFYLSGCYWFGWRASLALGTTHVHQFYIHLHLDGIMLDCTVYIYIYIHMSMYTYTHKSTLHAVIERSYWQWRI